MKKAFENPSIHISKFHIENIITTSGEYTQTAADNAKAAILGQRPNAEIVSLKWTL